MRVRAFITHKLNEKYKDCQDRFSINTEDLSVAVSDGMSESIFPHYWSEILSSAYTEGKYQSEEDVKSLCGDWHSKVSDYIDKSRQEGTLHWRTEANFLEGKSAGATLCGVKFKNSAYWSGHVLGDSCLITLKDNKIEEIYSSEDKPFDSYPDYYDSNPNNSGRGKVKEISGKISECRKILLVSDPFSEFLSIHKDESDPLIAELLSLQSHEDFCAIVDKWRSQGMHNDDSTLVIIEWNGRKSMEIVFSDDIYQLIDEESNIANSEEKCSKNDSEPENQVVSEEKATTENAPEETVPKSQIPFQDEVASEKECQNNAANENREGATPSQKESQPVNKQENTQTGISFEEFATRKCDPKPMGGQSATTVISPEPEQEKQTVSKKLELSQEYLIGLISNYKSELDKFFKQNSQRKKGTKFQKHLNLGDVAKKCMNLFDDLIDTIEKM